ncbi:MAG: peptide chain release factor N(5)-glutamine methyltransferase [Actinobacteria bacterium]|nr:peptide chain release factor N(5)-glutamine methyltransferase [Actinomycetota bacterium]
MSEDTPPLTIGEVVRKTTSFLAARGVSSARLDAELLVAHALGIDRLRVYTEHDRPLTRAETARCRALVARRGRREPLAYITGTRRFRNLQLAVAPAVLVPRPETETLVEWVLSAAPIGARVLDWGTGSGAIALALADERDDLHITGADRSPVALGVARENDDARRVTWIVSDGFSALQEARFDVIVANPPYLSEAELAEAPRELSFEPPGALAAGPIGTETIASLVREAPNHLDAAGWLITEIGARQASDVSGYFAGAGFLDVAVRYDLAMNPRAVGGRRA